MPYRPTILALLALLAAAVPATAAAAPVPEGADWSEATFPSSDGVTLHADVLRPKGLAPDAKTPVILSIGPYFNHSGQTGAVGPVEDTSYDPVGSRGRPARSGCTASPTTA
jgi:dipeptidyl aminopeptidase/acylaminoacyl peptidase